MAAAVLQFPRPSVTRTIDFDELLTAIETLARVRHRQVSAIQEAIFADYREECRQVLRAAGIVCPGDGDGAIPRVAARCEARS